jgi:DNA-binding transcriptional regulator YdaS (Cro superfamily)
MFCCPLFRLTQGKVTRAELREIWSSYRDMEGKKRPRALTRQVLRSLRR